VGGVGEEQEEGSKDRDRHNSTPKLVQETLTELKCLLAGRGCQWTCLFVSPAELIKDG